MSTPPPSATVMQMMMAAWSAQTISAVTRLGVADVLQKQGPLTARELAANHGIAASPEFLSVRGFVELIGGRWWPLFGRLTDALRTGRHQAEREPWERSEAAHTEAFAQAMKSRVQSTRGVVAHGDFSRARHVVDVGGGFGHLALALLERYPELRATVLDVPEVIAFAEHHAAAEDPDVGARLTLVGGDMFTEVPAGDTYVVKTVIHDWDDDRAVRVLRNCRARLPDGGRVICADTVLPPMGDTGASGAKLLDMLMMVSLPGKEHTEAEWRALYDRAGLAITAITLINPGSGASLIEGVPR